MKKIKPIIQRDFKDCGVCCMQWIINFYNGYVSLEKLREETLTDSNGTNFYQMKRTFNWVGFDAMGYYNNDISSYELKMPLIAHLKLKNGLEHFVVVRYVKNKTVYLMDPAYGYKKISLDNFNDMFTGNIIMVYPRENILTMTNNSSIGDIFNLIINKEKFLISIIIITSILWTIFTIVSSYYLKIGSNLIDEDLNIIIFMILSFLIFLIIKVFLEYLRNYYENHLNNKIDVYIYPGFINHLFNIPLRSIKSRTTGEIMTRIDELGNIKSLFSEIFVTIIIDIFLLITSIIVLCSISSYLFFILTIFLIIYIIISVINNKKMYKEIRKNIEYHTDTNSTLLEIFDNYDSIINLNLKNKFLVRIEKVLSQYLFHNYSFNSFFNLSNMINKLILELGVFTINSCGLFMVINNKISIIDLFTFNIFLGNIMDSLKNVINLIPKYNYVKASFAKINDFINIKELEQTIENKNLKGDIIFKNVSYSYNNYDFILKDLNFKINENNHVLLKGPSGFGKSTICNLIAGNLKKTNGEIYIGEYNIDDVNINTIKEQIMYVSQQEKIFTGSIKDNILLDRYVDDKWFNKVCEITKVDEIINKKSMRYDSLVGPYLDNLSGGEKQRIILARSLIDNKNIYIFDEALSEVNIELEESIIKNINEYFKDKTIIYISHKNVISNFDKIIDIRRINEVL